MTELDLYKFIHENNIEYHWEIDGYGSPDILIFIPFGELKEFTDMLGYHEFDEGGIECVLKDDCIALWMREICETHDIEASRIFKQEHNR